MENLLTSTSIIKICAIVYAVICFLYWTLPLFWRKNSFQFFTWFLNGLILASVGVLMATVICVGEQIR